MSAVLRILRRSHEDDEALIGTFVLGRPEATQRAYTGETKAFLLWANKPCHQVRSNDLRGYIEACRRRNLKAATIHKKAVIIKALFSFLLREKAMDEDPLALVEVPPCPPPGQPRGLTPEGATKFFGAMSSRSIASIRDRGMFLLMAATGLRISEVCALSVRDVSDSEEKDWKVLRVTGKGAKERQVHVGPPVWAVVLSYLQRRADTLCDDVPLFAATQRAKPIKAMAADGRLSKSSVYVRFKRVAAKSGLPKEFSPHSLRHFFACEADASGASVEAIRLALGHSGLGTTQKYLARIRRGVNEAFAAVKLPKIASL